MQTSATPLAFAVADWLLRPAGLGATRKIIGVPCALGSDPGLVRSDNQDRVLAARYRDGRGRPFFVVALADGMGGLRHGAESAAVALGALVDALIDPDAERLANEERLSWAALRANDAVHSIYEGDGGCTLVAVLVSDTGASCWLSVGDSRVYQGGDRGLVQLSKDDTLAGQLGPRGDDAGSQLLQFIGMGAAVEPHVSRFDTSAGGSILLTSDGVHYLDKTPYFGNIVATAIDGFQAARRLIEVAKWCGGPDNASCAVLTVAASLGRAVSGAPYHLELNDPYGELTVMVLSSSNLEKSAMAKPSPNQKQAHEPASPAINDGDSSPRKRPKKKRKGLKPEDADAFRADNDVQIDFLGKDSE